MATAGATLVLSGATFAPVRSGNRTVRAAERSFDEGWYAAAARPLDRHGPR